MANLRIMTQSQLTRAYLRKIRLGLNPVRVSSILEKVAFRSWRRLIIATPKGHTGLTRQSWKVIKGRGGWIVINAHKVMRFLETGTQAHGPRRARALWIPLSMRAGNSGPRAGLVYGKDFIFAQRVRGIQAMRIVERERSIVAMDLQRTMTRAIVHILHTT